MSTNQGQSWTLMAGGVGNPLIIDTVTEQERQPGSASPTPQRRRGQDRPGRPRPTSNAVQDAIYAGWLYAAVATPTGGFYGLFVTKDFGENWTQVQTARPCPRSAELQPGRPDQLTPAPLTATTVNYAITDNTPGQRWTLALTVDPTNPNITYLGGFGGNGYNSDTGLIRVDATNVFDAHSWCPLRPGPGYQLTAPEHAGAGPRIDSLR